MALVYKQQLAPFTHLRLSYLLSRKVYPLNILIEALKEC
jgi:hypothetical protein